ncbi:MAG TPA: HAD family hydrolase [Clostridiales bacterium]|nr:HAD family hydrolase [Clostridiales bacterium]
MKKVVLLDFYGTVVHDNKLVVDYICNELQKTGDGSCHDEIICYFRKKLFDLCSASFARKFRKQRTLMLSAIKHTAKRFRCTANPELLAEHLYKFLEAPPVFEDALEFLNKCPLPVVIVSNNDTIDLQKALAFIKYYPKYIATSELARAYKPNPRIFEYALERLNLKPDEAIYVGDNIEYDIKGAKSAGLTAVWLNRYNKLAPPEADFCISSLPELLTTGLLD